MSSETLAALAAFASRVRLADVADDVVETARRSLMDTLACMLGGATVAPVQRLAAALHEPGGSAVIVGTGQRSHPLNAAFVGGTAGTWMDADSGGTKHPAGGRVPPVPTAHPPVHLLPAMFASLPNSGPITGEELLRIYLVSYEIGARIGNATRLLPGVHPHGIHGTSSAALASGLIRNVLAADLAEAMDIATALPIVSALRVAMTGATVRNAYAGIGARNGMVALDAALAGTVAPSDAFNSVLRNVVSDTLDEERLLANLGRDWESARGYIKLHACARWIHSALDALKSLLPPAGLDVNTIESVDVQTFRFAAMMNDPHPSTDLGCKFSVPYCLAALAVFGRVELEAFTPEAMRRPDLHSLAARVRVLEDDRYTRQLPERRPTTVTLRYRDGRVENAFVEASRGDPERPATLDELEGKFVRLASAALGEPLGNSALGLIRRLAELRDSSELLAAVAG